MSLLMSLVPTLPIVAHVEASSDLASIPVVCEFPDVFPEDLPRFHRIGMWSFSLS